MRRKRARDWYQSIATDLGLRYWISFFAKSGRHPVYKILPFQLNFFSNKLCFSKLKQIYVKYKMTALFSGKNDARHYNTSRYRLILLSTSLSSQDALSLKSEMLQNRISFGKLTHYGHSYDVEIKPDPSNIAYTPHRYSQRVSKSPMG